MLKGTRNNQRHDGSENVFWNYFYSHRHFFSSSNNQINDEMFGRCRKKKWSFYNYTGIYICLPDRYTDSKVGEKSLRLGKMSGLRNFKRVNGFDFTAESLQISKLAQFWNENFTCNAGRSRYFGTFVRKLCHLRLFVQKFNRKRTIRQLTNINKSKTRFQGCLSAKI